MASPPPNVLLLFSDQLRRDALGAYGNSIVHTPNVDRLAAGGTTWESAYTPSPVCVAARYCLLTGHRSRVHGHWSNDTDPMDPAVPALPRILRNAGYITQVVGKMHFQPPRDHHGFDRMLLMEETPETREEDDYLLYLKSVGLGNVRHQHGVRHLLYHQPQRSLLPDEHTGNRWVADRSIEFLRANAGRPFFLWSSWIAPHPPFNAVDRWAGFYDAEKMPPPLERPGEIVTAHARAMRYLADVDGDPERKPRRVRRMKACYYAQVSHVDENVGRVLDALDELGLSENTIVAFASDHGEMLGDHGAWQKSCGGEGAWAIPMILRWPGRLPAGARRRDFVSLLDLLPTFLDACGVKYPAFPVPLPGASLLDSDGLRGRETIVGEERRGEHRFLAIRNRRHKLVYWFQDGTEELYDLDRDPGELYNLVAEGMDADAREARRDLAARLIEHERRCGPESVSDALPNFGKPDVWGLRRNSQLPSWPPNLIRPEEIAALNGFDDEILRAIEKEPDTRLSELDLDYWVSHGGSRRLSEKARRR